jgi:Cdc6-like AAA superfamily ATPase
MSEMAKVHRIAAIASAFTPGAPVDRLDMLAGRWNQLTDIVSAVQMTGQHVGLYGERGVGKTSLANVLSEFFATEPLRTHFQTARINCTTEDDYADVWRSVFAEIDCEVSDQAELTPESVRRILQELQQPAIIVLDELDRLANDEALTALADTIKTLSDHAVRSTVVLVGVASSISDLIGEHASIVRALVQIQMPRMSRRELAEIITKGCKQAEIGAQPDAIDEITALSAGLPHYTHLLSLHSGQRAVQDDRDTVTLADVHASIRKAVDRHTNLDDYLHAVRSARKDALFAQVLLACALAPKNDLGFFTSGAIRDPLEVIAGKRIDIPAFSNHLSQFLETARGSVLQREGTSRRYFYRFSDPIFQPFVILRGLADGLITSEQRAMFESHDPELEATPGEYEPTVPPTLF